VHLIPQTRRLRLETLEDRRLLALSLLGTEFSVGVASQSQCTYSQCPAPTVDFDAAGNMALVWAAEGDDEADAEGHGIYAQRFDLATAPLGDQFQVNTTTPHEQKYAGIALDDSGDFVVTWSSMLGDNSGYGVYARRYDADGTPRGDEFRVNTEIAGNQVFSAVAIDADGDFAVTWTSQDQDGSGSGIYAQRYASDGTPSGGEFQVNTTTEGNQRYPSVAMDAAGNFVVAWTSQDQDGSGGGIYAQRYASDGTPDGGEFLVNTTTEGNQQLSSLSVNAAGDCVIAWQSFDLQSAAWNVYVQRFDPEGVALGGETSLGPGRSARVAVGPVGDFVVAWENHDPRHEDPVRINLQHYDSLGTTLGDMLIVDDGSGHDRTAPSVAVTTDRAMFSWTSDLADGPRLAAQLCVLSSSATSNHPPELGPIATRRVAENDTLSMTPTATDPDGPATVLSFSLEPVAPTGAAIDSATGELTWTPDESQGPGTYDFTIRVTDNGSPPLSDTATFSVIVDEVNQAPVIGRIGEQWIGEGGVLSLTATADDDDLPANALIFSLDPGAPEGSVIDAASGEFTYAPTEQQGGNTFSATIRATDDGSPALSDATTFSINVEELNQAPVLDGISDWMIAEGETLTVDVTAADVDDPPDTLTFGLIPGAPAGATIDPAGGEFSWTPHEGQGPGQYSITVRVTDDGFPALSDTVTFSVIVTEANQPPELLSIDDQTIDELDSLSLTALAIDPDSPPNSLTFALDPGVPAGATIDPATGEFLWTPTESQGPGAFSVTVHAIDDGSPMLSDSITFAVTVNEVNEAPVLDAIADRELKENETLLMTVTAADADVPANAFTFALEPGAPAGMVIDPATGVLSWEPQPGQGDAVYEVTVRVTDDGVPARADTTTFSVSVSMVNHPPVLDPIDDQTAPEDAEFSLTAVATDSDVPANTLTFSLDPGSPSAATIDSQTGEFRWTPSEAYGPGSYRVTIRVTDDGTPTESAVESFMIAVEEVNRPPALGEVSPKTVREEQALSFFVSAVDPDQPSNALSYSLEPGAPAGAAVDPAFGRFTWTPAEDQGPATYNLTVRVTDDGSPPMSDITSFPIEVSERNNPPRLEPIDRQTIAEGETLRLLAVAGDPDTPHDTLTFSLAPGAPSGAVIDPATGQFAWTTTEENGPGAYSVTVLVTDAGTPAMVDTVTFPITVNEVNRPPVLEQAARQTAAEGELFSLATRVTDPDVPANSLSFRLEPGAPAGAAIDPPSGVFTWTPSEGQAPGTYSITVRVTDDGSPALSNMMTFVIDVAERNNAPVLQPVADQTIGEQNELRLTIAATDPDTPADVLTFSLEPGAPQGAAVHPVTGTFTWTPTEEQGPGAYSVTVRVTDDGTPAMSSTVGFSITVEEVNLPPVLAGIGDQTTAEGDLFSLRATATDPDTPPNLLAFSLEPGAPAGAAIDPATGVFSWTPSELQSPGVYEIAVRVTDNAPLGASDTARFWITVIESNHAPVLDDIADRTIVEGEFFSLLVAASDSDVPADTLTYRLEGDPPAGAAIDPYSGLFSWQPTEAQGPATYVITIRVTDDGSPPMSDVTSLTIRVDDENRPPVIEPIADQTVAEGDTLSLSAVAGDVDVPAETITFTLDEAPPGAVIDRQTGEFTFTPTEGQGPGTYQVTVRATDDGLPSAAGTESFTVAVSEINRAPVLDPINNQTATEGETLSVTATGTDLDEPANVLRFSLDEAPPGATIDPGTGLLTFTPSETQGATVHQVVVRVSDDGTPALSDTISFTIAVGETNLAPAFGAVADQTIGEGELFSLSLAAIDGDDPADTLSYSLGVGAPDGVAIDPHSGLLSFTPTETQGPGTYDVSVRVVDDGSPPLGDEVTFSIIVAEVNQAPVLDPIEDRSAAVGKTFTWTAVAADADLPGNAITFGLGDDAPDDMTIDPSSGAISWTPLPDRTPDIYPITVRATDDGTPPLAGTTTFNVSLFGLSAFGDVDWRNTDFLDVPPQNVADGDRFSLRPVRSGRLSIEALFAHAEGNIDLTLLDPDGAVLAASNSSNDNERVDAIVNAGDMIDLIVAGANPNVAFRVANLLVDRGVELIVFGTSGDDTIIVSPGSPHRVNVNGAFYNVDASRTRTITVIGDAGEDSLVLYGSAQNETAAFSPGAVELLGPDYRVDAAQVEQVELFAGAGNDTATMDDSPGNDLAVLTPGYGLLYGDGFRNEARNCELIEARADAGGADLARMYDSAGDDLLAASPAEAAMSGVGFENRALSFDQVHVFATGGGDDKAEIHDSAGDDQFVASPSEGFLYGAGFYVRAKHFETVEAHATGGGNDTAWLYDSAGDDEFVGSSVEGAMIGAGFNNRAKQFDYVEALSNGGSDTAWLFDSNGDDFFVATRDYASLFGSRYQNVARSFEVVEAYATRAGRDVAKLYDTAGDDLFVTTPIYGGLSGTGFSNRARHFDEVHAFATAGGYDLAKMYDSPVNDTFYASPIEGVMFGDGFYNRGKFFEAVHAFATAGGEDVALFHDSAGDDTFFASPIESNMAGAGFFNRGKFFEVVQAFADAGGNDTAQLADSPGDDSFYATPEYGLLEGAGFYNRARSFDTLIATALAGGNDLAELVGSAGDDTFVATPVEATLSGAGFSNHAKYFDEVHGDGSTGGHDAAYLYDSALIDVLEADGHWTRLRNDELGFRHWVSDYEFVKAISNSGPDRKSVGAAVDFLVLEGDWEDL